MKVTILHRNREKVFHQCEDLEDAKLRFQWRYGYWPYDESVVEIDEDDNNQINDYKENE